MDSGGWSWEYWGSIWYLEIIGPIRFVWIRTVLRMTLRPPNKNTQHHKQSIKNTMQHENHKKTTLVRCSIILMNSFLEATACFLLRFVFPLPASVQLGEKTNKAEAQWTWTETNPVRKRKVQYFWLPTFSEPCTRHGGVKAKGKWIRRKIYSRASTGPTQTPPTHTKLGGAPSGSSKLPNGSWTTYWAHSFCHFFKIILIQLNLLMF